MHTVKATQEKHNDYLDSLYKLINDGLARPVAQNKYSRPAAQFTGDGGVREKTSRRPDVNINEISVLPEPTKQVQTLKNNCSIFSCGVNI